MPIHAAHVANERNRLNELAPEVDCHFAPSSTLGKGGVDGVQTLLRSAMRARPAEVACADRPAILSHEFNFHLARDLDEFMNTWPNVAAFVDGSKRRRMRHAPLAQHQVQRGQALVRRGEAGQRGAILQLLP